MNTSVLERQRDVLQRLYHHLHHPQYDGNNTANLNFDCQQILLSHCSWQSVNPELKPDQLHFYEAVSDGDNSSMTRATMSKPDHPQCSNGSPNREASNVSSSTKKRKAEFIEEEGEDKGPEVEEIGEEKSEITMKGNGETSARTCSKSEVEKPDYIHVRARRGQATDSHSLAERARREKISKKMKCLQDLVPGCDKVSGKAGMLDEIINYVQSLQKQVEFLSMKLATLNPRLDLSTDSFFSKEIPQLHAANSTCFQYNPMQQGVADPIAMDQSQMLTQQEGRSSLPISEAFLPQLQLSGWDPDLTSLFNVGFH